MNIDICKQCISCQDNKELFKLDNKAFNIYFMDNQMVFTFYFFDKYTDHYGAIVHIETDELKESVYSIQDILRLIKNKKITNCSRNSDKHSAFGICPYQLEHLMSDFSANEY